MTNVLNVLGTVRKFNGVNIDRTRDFNHFHCQTYIERIVSHHGWENETLRSRPAPMKTNNKYLADIQLHEGPKDQYEARKLQKKMGFNYRQCIGELIYALTVCHIDISIAVIKLSQHSNHPA